MISSIQTIPVMCSMRFDIDSLRAFKTVLEVGGVTRPAQKLNLTQSAVSHKLAPQWSSPWGPLHS
jgi:hypothetical protein